MKKMLENLASRLIKGLKSIALAYLLVQILTNRFPGILAWVDEIVFYGNQWFAGLGAWAAKAVNWVAGILVYVQAWLPLIGHTIMVILVWKILTFLVDVLNGKGSSHSASAASHKPATK